MNRQGITADQAFALLRKAPKKYIKLIDVAHTITDRHIELDP